MQYKNNILEAIGQTPLVRLNKIVDDTCATVLAKCEYLNPAGSIKDRMAAYIIEDAERRGLLKPGGTIVENTSGNTGMGLAMAAAVKGYRCVFTMPDKMSQEKVNSLKAFGAKVVITPTDVPGDSPDHYVETAKRIARETPGAFYVNQYHCQENIEAHYRSTGPEIWEQTQGQFDVLVSGVGTGGTISGTGRYLKEKSNNRIRIVGVDPLGSVHYHYFYTGTIPNAYVYKVEGIGEDIKCDAFDVRAVDEMRQVDDRESFTMARRLVREEGLFCGGSCGSNVHAAAQIARELGPGKTVVVLLPDSGTRYISKYLSDAWMRDHGMLEPERQLGRVEDLLRARPDHHRVHTVAADKPIRDAVQIMRQHGISQLPVTAPSGMPTGIVHEVDVLRGLQTAKVALDHPVSSVAGRIGGLVYPKARVEELFSIFATDQVAVVVDMSRIVGVISQIDLIEYMAHKRQN